VGIDLGQAADPSAICVIALIRCEFTEQFLRQYRLPSGRWMSEAEETLESKPKDSVQIRALERLPLGLSYVAQAEMIASRLARPELERADVLIDATGCGRPVCDLFRAAGVRHTPVLITGGAGESGDTHMLHVPKLILISQLQAALHSGELKIAKSLPEATAFTRELQEFRASWTEAGHLRFGARQGAHDDLVLAAALALHGVRRKSRMSATVSPLRM